MLRALGLLWTCEVGVMLLHFPGAYSKGKVGQHTLIHRQPEHVKFQQLSPYPWWEVSGLLAFWSLGVGLNLYYSVSLGMARRFGGLQGPGGWKGGEEAIS